MNNPTALRFVNENVRQMAERLRAVKALLDSDLQRWAEVSSHFATGADPVEDGREAEGVTRLTCADVTAFMQVCSNLKGRFDLNGVAATVDRPCVRTLTAS
jgi:hypothetical protein